MVNNDIDGVYGLNKKKKSLIDRYNSFSLRYRNYKAYLQKFRLQANTFIDHFIK